MLKNTLLLTGACALLSSPVWAQDSHEHHHEHDSHEARHIHFGNVAPMSIMGEHMHQKGDFMLSYRRMWMDMDGNRQGTDRINPVTIATTIPNRFSATAGQPPTLRVVPTKMTMDMHMVGGMYAPSDSLTLMVMGNYLEKDMDHITFAGGSGTTELGRFSTHTSGWGDTVVSGLVRLYEDHTHHAHINLGVSLPTGSIDETGTVLAPSGATPLLRLPYAMQLGTGTYDLHPGITYTGQAGRWGWGAQYKAEIRLEDENDEGYAWGDKHSITAWSGYDWSDFDAPWLSTTAHVTARTQGKIDGIDPNILAPVQTADPDNYGGQTIEAGLGIIITPQSGILKDQNFGFDVSVPLYRDLNGVQLETDMTAVFGWKVAF